MKFKFFVLSSSILFSLVACQQNNVTSNLPSKEESVVEPSPISSEIEVSPIIEPSPIVSEIESLSIEEPSDVSILEPSPIISEESSESIDISKKEYDKSPTLYPSYVDKNGIQIASCLANKYELGDDCFLELHLHAPYEKTWDNWVTSVNLELIFTGACEDNEELAKIYNFNNIISLTELIYRNETINWGATISSFDLVSSTKYEKYTNNIQKIILSGPNTGNDRGTIQCSKNNDFNATFSIETDEYYIDIKYSVTSNVNGTTSYKDDILETRIEKFKMSKEKIDPYEDEREVIDDGIFNVTCVGDSITFGVNSTSGHSYPSVLQNMLGLDYNVINCGASGSGAQIGKNVNWGPGNYSYYGTGEYIKARQSQADVVLVMLGTNDAYSLSLDKPETIENYYNSLKKICESFANMKSSPKVCIISSPYRNDIAARTVNLRDIVVPTQKKLAEDMGYGYLDMFDITTKAIVDEKNNYLSDGVHFNDSGYKFMAEKIYDAFFKEEIEKRESEVNYTTIQGYTEGGTDICTLKYASLDMGDGCYVSLIMHAPYDKIWDNWITSVDYELFFSGECETNVELQKKFNFNGVSSISSLNHNNNSISFGLDLPMTIQSLEKYGNSDNIQRIKFSGPKSGNSRGSIQCKANNTCVIKFDVLMPNSCINVLAVFECNVNGTYNHNDDVISLKLKAFNNPFEEYKNNYEYHSMKSLENSIKTLGRTVYYGESMSADWSGTGFEINVFTEGDIYISTLCERDYKDYVGATYLTVEIDGVRTSERGVLADEGFRIVKIASNLKEGNHNIRVIKQAHNQHCDMLINGLFFNGEVLDKPSNNKYIEFIGDSITCGYGVYSNPKGDSQQFEYTDATKSYAYIASKDLGCDYSLVCRGSWGISTASIDQKNTIPDVYDLVCYSRNRDDLYDFERKPDAVVINLGTNDQLCNVDKTVFKTRFLNFIENIYEKNGSNIKIIFAYNMMSDGYQSIILKIAEELGGEANGIYTIKLDRSTGGGDGHPTMDAQEQAGHKLAQFIQDKLGF